MLLANATFWKSNFLLTTMWCFPAINAASDDGFFFFRYVTLNCDYGPATAIWSKILNLFQRIKILLSKFDSLIPTNRIFVGRIIFHLVRFRPWDPTTPLDIWKKTKHFLTMQSQDSETTARHVAIRCCVTATLVSEAFWKHRQTCFISIFSVFINNHIQLCWCLSCATCAIAFRILALRYHSTCGSILISLLWASYLAFDTQGLKKQNYR